MTGARGRSALHAATPHRAWIVFALLFLGLMIPGSTAPAQDFHPGILEHKLEVRLVGYLDRKAEEVHPWRELVVRIVGTSGNERNFALTDVIVVSGDASGIRLIEGLLPTRPNLFIAGDKDVLRDIASSSPDDLLKITGFIAFGSRWFLVYRFEREGGSAGR
jgi:hypothetical protein